jgi:hypothetical protein
MGKLGKWGNGETGVKYEGMWGDGLGYTYGTVGILLAPLENFNL